MLLALSGWQNLPSLLLLGAVVGASMKNGIPRALKPSWAFIPKVFQIYLFYLVHKAVVVNLTLFAVSRAILTMSPGF